MKHIILSHKMESQSPFGACSGYSNLSARIATELFMGNTLAVGLKTLTSLLQSMVMLTRFSAIRRVEIFWLAVWFMVDGRWFFSLGFLGFGLDGESTAFLGISGWASKKSL